MTAPEYMMDVINYGGVLVPRGYAYQLLIDFAKAQGHSKRESRVLADRWMQGYDLRQQMSEAEAVLRVSQACARYGIPFRDVLLDMAAKAPEEK